VGAWVGQWPRINLSPKRPEKSADHALIESNLWCCGRNPLTTRRFTRKVNTHFTMLAPQLVPSALTNSVPVILQFPIPQPRDPVRSLRHMTTQLLNEAAQVIPNQQLLINVVSKRVRQLGLGHRPLVETTPRMSLTDIALKEIIAGKLAYESLEESSDGA
jgi:DNA-directed RNA polymerase subunit omega